MQRFLVFCGSSYYPGGGMMDFAADFATLDQAAAYCKRRNEDWHQIVDTQARKHTFFCSDWNSKPFSIGEWESF